MTTLPQELIFNPTGHLTDAALACVADGEQGLVPTSAMGHLDTCEGCSHRLGEAALLSLCASDARDFLRAPALVPARPLAHDGGSGIRGRRPLPVAAIAAALVLAVLTAGPSLVAAIRAVPETIAGAAAAAPFLVHVVTAFARAPWGGGAALLVKGASALILVAVGLQVARQTSRARSTMGDPWQQGGG